MKANIHPNYSHEVEVHCACGNVFFTGSTMKSIKVDLCSACHPFFTGEMKFVDTQGRVEKFQQRAKQAAGSYVSKKQRRQSQKTQQAQPNSVQSLRDLLVTQKRQNQQAQKTVKADGNDAKNTEANSSKEQ